MPNTSIQSPSVRSASFQITDRPESYRTPSLIDKIKNVAGLSLRAALTASSLAGGLTLLSIGGSASLPVGALLVACSACFAFMFAREQIRASEKRMSNQVGKHRELIENHKLLLERQEASIKELSCQVIELRETNMSIADTANNMQDIAESLAKSSCEISQCLGVLQNVSEKLMVKELAGITPPVMQANVLPSAPLPERTEFIENLDMQRKSPANTRWIERTELIDQLQNLSKQRKLVGTSSLENSIRPYGQIQQDPHPTKN